MVLCGPRRQQASSVDSTTPIRAIPFADGKSVLTASVNVGRLWFANLVMSARGCLRRWCVTGDRASVRRSASGSEFLCFRGFVNVPFAVGLPQWLFRNQLLVGKADVCSRPSHLGYQAQHGEQLDDPPRGIGTPAAVRPGSGGRGIGV